MVVSFHFVALLRWSWKSFCQLLCEQSLLCLEARRTPGMKHEMSHCQLVVLNQLQESNQVKGQSQHLCCSTDCNTDENAKSSLFEPILCGKELWIGDHCTTGTQWRRRAGEPAIQSLNECDQQIVRERALCGNSACSRKIRIE